MPEVYEDEELVGYDPNAIYKNPGAVVLIEDVLHDDDEDEQDYARCVDFTDRVFPLNSSFVRDSKLLK